MKVIVAGSRTITDYVVVEDAIIASPFFINEIVSGCARGVDSLAIQWAEIRGTPITKFPAEWNKYGRKAGLLRNVKMAEYADALIAVWDGWSRGTKHMITIAQEAGLAVYVHQVPKL